VEDLVGTLLWKGLVDLNGGLDQVTSGSDFLLFVYVPFSFLPFIPLLLKALSSDLSAIVA